MYKDKRNEDVGLLSGWVLGRLVQPAGVTGMKIQESTEKPFSQTL
jgi:hypothetical protein